MLRNYFKIAWRNLKIEPFFTLLNMFGLAIGMAGSLLIALYIYDELSFNNTFPDAERIYRVNADVKFGGKVFNSAQVSDPVAQTLKKDLPQVELATRFLNNSGLLLKKTATDTNVKALKTTFVDSTFFDMFGVELQYGNPKTALVKANTLVLTKAAAEKHFGIKDALGKSLILDNKTSYLVTGIIEDLPKNSILGDFSVFMSMSGNTRSRKNEWGSQDFVTFIKLSPNANMASTKASIKGLFGKYVIPFVQTMMPGITEKEFIASGNYFDFSIINLEDIHLHSTRPSVLYANGSIKNVYILACIGLFLIVLASVNFVNLSTAYSLKRAKEVGIRKALGSNKIELISQFLAESGLITFISLIIAIAITTIAIPFFNDLSGKLIVLPFTKPLFWIVIFVATVFLGLLSGIYPAFYMSRFIPVDVLKGGASSNIGGVKTRQSLVVFQFAISVFLIVSTLVVFEQLNFIQKKDLGYGKDRVLIIEDVDVLGRKRQAFKTEVGQLTSVKNATLSGYLPTPSNRQDASYFEEGFMQQEDALHVQQWQVDYDYIATLDLEIIAGRAFSKAYSTDSRGVILNETAVAYMGVSPEEVLGKRITNDIGQQKQRFFTVIGVVKNFHFESLKTHIEALGLFMGNGANAMAVKIKEGQYAATIDKIETLWKTQASGQLFNYYFLEDAFNNSYKAEQRLGRIFITFTVLSILIACLGLFGLAAFSAQKRSKEIGVRKVLGASVTQITYKLSVDFLKLVGIAILIALPLARYAMNTWLEDFEYRIEIGWSVFILATMLALAVSLLTVSFQSIKAAIVNPIKSLRTE